MPMKKRAAHGRAPTISEIAEEIGVSAMTVSRVLNGRPDVAPATRERIERVVAERGYARNRAASALRKGRSGLIDLVVVALDSAYHLEIIRGVEERLEPTGFRMALSATHGQAQRRAPVGGQGDRRLDRWRDPGACRRACGAPEPAAAARHSVRGGRSSRRARSRYSLRRCHQLGGRADGHASTCWRSGTGGSPRSAARPPWAAARSASPAIVPRSKPLGCRSTLH